MLALVLLLLLRLCGDEMKFVPWRRVGAFLACSVVTPAKPHDLSRERAEGRGSQGWRTDGVSREEGARGR